MLNNHLGTVKRMLQEASVDVNGKDDNGRTLLAMAMLDIEEPKCVEFAKFLIEKGADVNLGDVNKTAPLHILAQTRFDSYRHGRNDKKEKQNEKDFNKRLIDMIDLLLAKGADVKAKTEAGMTPFEVALDCNNINVLQKFTSSVKLNESP